MTTIVTINEVETDKVLELVSGYYPAVHRRFKNDPKNRKLQCIAWARGFNRLKVTYDEAIKAVDKHATSTQGVFEPTVSHIITIIKDMRS